MKVQTSGAVMIFRFFRGSCALAMAALQVVGTLSFAQQDTNNPDGAGSYVTDHYRNLFAEDGHTEAEIRSKIEAAYQQLFHGEPREQATAFSAGSNKNGPLMYVTDWANHDVRTEGMSYGMMIAVQLDKKADFDALWNWAKTNMYISDPKH